MDTLTINTIWRPVYGQLVKAIRLLTPEWQNLGMLKNFNQFSMRGINWPVELVNGGGIAYTSNGGSTARATSNAPVEATDTWKHITGRFEVGYDELSAENDGKFAQAQIEKQLRYQAADKARAFRRAIAIGFYGYPDAILFETTGSGSVNSGTSTVAIDNLYGVTGLSARRIRDYITVGKDKIAVISDPAGSPTIVASGVVTAINETAKTISFTSGDGASITSNMAIVLYNQVKADGTTDLDQGINGLLHLTKSTTVHNIAESSQPDWAPAVRIDNYGQALAGADLYYWFEEIEQRSDHKPTWAWTTTGAIAAAGGQELDQRRYGADDDTMRLGFRKLNVMGVQAEGRPYCPAGHLFLGSNTALRKLSPDESLDPKNLVNGDRAGGFKQYENTLGFYKDQVLRAQLTAVARLGLGVVSGVEEEVPSEASGS